MKTSIIIPVITTLVVASSQYTEAQLDTMCSVNLDYSKSQKFDFKNNADNNELSYDMVEAEFSVFHPISQDSMLISSIGYNRTQYDFKSESYWDDVESISTFLMYDRGINEQWSVFTLGMVQAAYESGAKFGDSISWGFAVGGTFQQSDTLKYSFGVAYLSRLEDDALIIPVFGVEWKINDRLLLNGMMGMELVYDITGDQRNLLSCGLDYNLLDFRLKKDGSDSASQALRPEGIGFFLGYTRQLTERFQFSAKLLGVSETKYETREDGRKISTIKTDPGVVGSVGFSFTF